MDENVGGTEKKTIADPVAEGPLASSRVVVKAYAESLAFSCLQRIECSIFRHIHDEDKP